MSIKNLVGEEVFIVTSSEEEEGEIFASNSMLGAIDFMRNLNPAVDSDTRVFHGILSSAEILPGSFKSKSVFIIFINPEEVDSGYVTEFGGDTPEELADEIESMVENSGLLFSNTVCIDDMLILYGYQLQTSLCIDEDGIDEEVIYTCRKIYDEVEDIIATKSSK
jgi:hypothetical protein